MLLKMWGSSTSLECYCDISNKNVNNKYRFLHFISEYIFESKTEKSWDHIYILITFFKEGFYFNIIMEMKL